MGSCMSVYAYEFQFHRTHYTVTTETMGGVLHLLNKLLSSNLLFVMKVHMPLRRIEQAHMYEFSLWCQCHMMLSKLTTDPMHC